MLYKRPMVGPNTVVYSFYSSLPFIPNKVKNVLEIGCGLGSFTYHFVRKYKPDPLWAVDISSELIDFMSLNYGHSKILFKSMDFCKQNLKLSQSFDFIFSSDVLEHVSNIPIFIENIYVNLSKSGTAIITFPNHLDHGVNHYHKVSELMKDLQIFPNCQIFDVRIDNDFIVYRWFWTVRNFYDKLIGSRFRKIRNDFDKKNVEHAITFEETAAYRFARESVGLKNDLACLFTDVLLLIRPK
ncbi:MAG: class I SAM-dependent methyltransferase, partial [Chitinivibrionales bacterium]|nr:class I SAM-dependent methyltransferase [Chitinivibrionales bacterium]